MGLLSPALLQLVEDHHCREILELVHHQEGSLGKNKSFVKNESAKRVKKDMTCGHRCTKLCLAFHWRRQTLRGLLVSKFNWKKKSKWWLLKTQPITVYLEWLWVKKKKNTKQQNINKKTTETWHLTNWVVWRVYFNNYVTKILTKSDAWNLELISWNFLKIDDLLKHE